MSLIGQCLKYSDGNHEALYYIYKFYQKRNFGDIWDIGKTDSNVSLISPETSIELSEVSERNASVAKTRNF
jgi:hypothetical protein